MGQWDGFDSAWLEEQQSKTDESKTDDTAEEAVDAPSGALRALRVEGLPPSLNKWYSGSHWSQRKRLKDEWRRRVRRALDTRPLAPIEEYPVRVHVLVQFGPGRTRYDADNLVPAAKLITDALVHEGILASDSCTKIQSVTLEHGRTDDESHVIYLINSD